MGRYRYWTREACVAASSVCGSRFEFRRRFPGAYCACKKHGWLEEASSHMLKEQQKERFVYGIFSSQRRDCYIGLSNKPTVRYQSHCRRATADVKRLLEQPHTFQILSGPHPASEAGDREKDAIKAAASRGWNLLNRHVGGGLGRRRQVHWSFEACRDEADKHQTRTAFRAASPGAYLAANRNGWMDAICGHMALFSVPRGYWTLERCRDAAQRHKSLSIMRRIERGAYYAAHRNGWLTDIRQYLAP